MWALSLSGLLNSLVQPTCVLMKMRKTRVNNFYKRKNKQRRTGLSHLKVSPERTLVFLKGFMNEHVSLHFVFPVERRLTEGTFIWLFT